jgi:ABC-type anion transport system duplicated permease subunit
VLLIIAGLIAAVGIFTNSQILIVGAMVVGPEYAAIISEIAAARRLPRDLVDALKSTGVFRMSMPESTQG